VQDWRQKEAARAAGFRTYNHEHEIIASLDDAVLALNVVDGHPSAALNVLYAEHLTQILADELQAGQLCPE